jgi:hypothetical protein
VRVVLQQSFTKLPTENIELYFTGTPGFNGATLSVPVALNEHDSPVQSFTLELQVVDGTGKALAANDVTAVPKLGLANVVATIRVPGGGQVVWVRLVGYSQTLHYRISGS